MSNKANNLFTLFERGLNTVLKVRRELRSSRNEARADRREERAEQNHWRKQQRSYFGREMPPPNSTEGDS